MDYWVVKINSSGNIEWDKTIGGSMDDEFPLIQQTNDGGYILGGTSNSDISGDKTQHSIGLTDYWVVKLDSLGSIEWDKTIGGSETESLSSIRQTTDSGYILGGVSDSDISGQKTENSRGTGWGRNDYWAVKLDKSGNVQWDKTVGGDNYDWLGSIDEVTKNNYLLGGFSESNVSGDKTKGSRGLQDYWIVLLHHNNTDSVNRIATENLRSYIVQHNDYNKTQEIYPNPAKDILHIQTNGEATFTLTNQSGKILLTKTITSKGEISVANLATGLYYLKNNTTGAVQRVVVTK